MKLFTPRNVIICRAVLEGQHLVRVGAAHNITMPCTRMIVHRAIRLWALSDNTRYKKSEDPRKGLRFVFTLDYFKLSIAREHAHSIMAFVEANEITDGSPAPTKAYADQMGNEALRKFKKDDIIKNQYDEILRLRRVLETEAKYCQKHADDLKSTDEPRSLRHQERADRLLAAMIPPL